MTVAAQAWIGADPFQILRQPGMVEILTPAIGSAKAQAQRGDGLPLGSQRRTPHIGAVSRPPEAVHQEQKRIGRPLTQLSRQDQRSKPWIVQLEANSFRRRRLQRHEPIS